jgi:gamma-glutamylcyclotransferase
MNHEQMKARCPQSQFVRRAFLREYKFVYDGYSTSCRGAVANIVPSNGDTVWGGLFEIDTDCLKVLDEYEGYPYFYDRKQLNVKDDENKTRKAMAYFRTGRIIGSPWDEYRSVILQGAKDCGLPKDYIGLYL